MSLDQKHLILNLFIGFITGLILGFIIWQYLPIPTILKIAATGLDIIFSAYVTHRYAPYLTTKLLNKSK